MAAAKAASRQQLTANPAAPAPEGGSPAEGETAEEQLAVPGPSGLCAGSRGSKPPVPVEEPTAAAMPAARDLPAKELVVAEAPLAVPEKGPEERQLEVMIAELPGVELSVPAAQAAAERGARERHDGAVLVPLEHAGGRDRIRAAGLPGQRKIRCQKCT